MTIYLKNGEKIEQSDEAGQEVIRRVRKALTTGMKGLVVFHDDEDVEKVHLVLNLDEIAAIV